MIARERAKLLVAAVAAVAALAAPSIAAVSQLFKAPDPQSSGLSCAELVTKVTDFARHYTVAARVYARPGPARGLPRLASSDELRRCGNPERLLERIVPPAPTRSATSRKGPTGPTGPPPQP